jgi:hypothetical protein
MANRLKMAMVHSIQTLLQRGWSRRRIARELGIDRETVGRYACLALAEAPPGSVGIGINSDADEPSKPARAPPGSTSDLTGTCFALEAFKTSQPEAPLSSIT